MLHEIHKFLTEEQTITTAAAYFTAVMSLQTLYLLDHIPVVALISQSCTWKRKHLRYTSSCLYSQISHFWSTSHEYIIYKKKKTIPPNKPITGFLYNTAVEALSEKYNTDGRTLVMFLMNQIIGNCLITKERIKQTPCVLGRGRDTEYWL